MASASQDEHVFQYRPLETADTTRVLIVLPGDEDAESIYRIKHIELDDPQPYVAISYVWGDPTMRQTICIDGHPIPVTDNLSTFLEYVRDGYDYFVQATNSADGILAFWIDAICINQKDLDERSQQVQRMKQIYERAATVVAWLGPGDENSDVAIRQMIQFRDYYDAKAAALNYKGANTAVMESISQGDEGLFGNLDESIDLAPWKAMHKFFKRDWWQRTWIVQESTADAVTTFVCGNFLLSRATLEITIVIFLGMVRVPRLQALEKITGIEVPLRLYIFRNQRQRGGSNMHLLPVLQFLRTYDATDLRDKIYAGLGLAVDYVPGDMRVDYGLSVADVYIELVRYFLEKSQSLDCLGEVGRSAHQVADLPTWAPDWSYYLARVSFSKYLDCGDGSVRPVYCPSGSSLTVSGRNIAIIERNKLLLRGVYIDRITSLGQPAAKSPSDTVIEMTWVPTDQQQAYEHTGETMLTAFFRTVVADVVMGNAVPVARASHLKWPLALGPDDGLLSMTAIAQESGGRYPTMNKSVTGRRCFATTARGYMGLVPSYAEIGDQIWVLLGGLVLYVLREAGKKYVLFGEKEYEFVGECYMHGLMDGEAMQPVNEGRVQLQTVVLK